MKINSLTELNYKEYMNDYTTYNPYKFQIRKINILVRAPYLPASNELDDICPIEDDVVTPSLEIKNLAIVS